MSNSNLLGFFNNHYVFGDSLSDVNNFSTLHPTTFPNRPFYKDGRFTNGLEGEGVWVDYYSNQLNLNLHSFYQTPISNTQGINFAVGADTSGSTNLSDLNNLLPLGLSNQVNYFANLVNGGIINSLGDSIVINWIGANDYFDVLKQPDNVDTPAEIENFSSQVVGNITTSLTTILNQGAKVVVVPNLVDLGLTPLAIANGASPILSGLSQAHNQALTFSLNQLRQSYPNAKIIEVDIYNFLGNSLSKFVNTTQGITDTNLYSNPVTVDMGLASGLEDYATVSQQAENYLWWDSAHPTTKAHQLISEYILKVIEDNIATRGTKGRDILTGGPENNLFIGSLGRDILTAGGGKNVFVYNNMVDAGDIIKGFTVGSDRLNMIGVLNSIGYQGNNPLAEGYITFTQRGVNTILNIDTNGSAPGIVGRPYMMLENVTANQLNNLANFILT